MNDRPARWLTEPTVVDEQALISQFCAYGVQPSLLSPQTLNLLGDHFDRFAPLMIAAQTPPYAPNSGLQGWFRPRANDTQGSAMRRALRDWLTEPGHESPRGSDVLWTTPSEIEEAVRKAQFVAAEALGDWRDPEAVLALRTLADSTELESLVVTRALWRIEHPDQPDALVLRPDGRTSLGRSAAEIDSLIVEATDRVTTRSSRSSLDRLAIERIWMELGATRAHGRERTLSVNPGSFRPERLQVYFADGERGQIEVYGDYWQWAELGRPSLRIDLVDSVLTMTTVEELQRMGVAPESPRFVAEWVTLWITAGELRVTGSYDFEGVPEDGWVPLLYPIAIGSGQGKPRIDAIRLESSADRERLPVAYEQQGSTCRITLTPGLVRFYRLEVEYRQQLEGRSARYLTTSAREWGRPLHRAGFQVIMDAALGEPRLSESFHEVAEGNGRRRFLFEASPYQPEQDIVVTW